LVQFHRDGEFTNPLFQQAMAARATSALDEDVDDDTGVTFGAANPLVAGGSIDTTAVVELDEEQQRQKERQEHLAEVLRMMRSDDLVHDESFDEGADTADDVAPSLPSTFHEHGLEGGLEGGLEMAANPLFAAARGSADQAVTEEEDGEEENLMANPLHGTSSPGLGPVDEQKHGGRRRLYSDSSERFDLYN